MSPDRLVQIEGLPRPALDRRQVLRVALNLAAVCALGAAVLGALHVGTERQAEATRLAGERSAITDLLDPAAGSAITEIRQSLARDGNAVVYRSRAYGDATATERALAFTLDGDRLAVPPADGAPLGRMFVVGPPAAPAGFVIEGESRGYKNRIRFFVALDSTFVVRGVRVLEHEEDPGLGAEIATPWFRGQFLGRRAGATATLEVTRDPLPEDWARALAELARTPVATWLERHDGLVRREGTQPVHAVTGATISSRALTDGVRATLEHFRRRWALLGPALEDAS